MEMKTSNTFLLNNVDRKHINLDYWELPVADAAVITSTISS